MTDKIITIPTDRTVTDDKPAEDETASPCLAQGIIDPAWDKKCLEQEHYPIPISAHPDLLRAINRGFTRLASKWFQMYLGFSCSLKEFDGHTVTYRVCVSRGCKLDTFEVIKKATDTWKTYVRAFEYCDHFVVDVYHLRSGSAGTVVNGPEAGREHHWARAVAAAIESYREAMREVNQGKVPYVSYHGAYSNPEALTVVHHPIFDRS